MRADVTFFTSLTIFLRVSPSLIHWLKLPLAAIILSNLSVALSSPVRSCPLTLKVARWPYASLPSGVLYLHACSGIKSVKPLGPLVELKTGNPLVKLPGGQKVELVHIPFIIYLCRRQENVTLPNVLQCELGRVGCKSTGIAPRFDVRVDGKVVDITRYL